MKVRKVKFQLDAINAVADLFERMESIIPDFTLSDEIVPNLYEDEILYKSNLLSRKIYRKTASGQSNLLSLFVAFVDNFRRRVNAS